MPLTKAEQQEYDYLKSDPEINMLSPEEQAEYDYLKGQRESQQQPTAEPEWTKPPEGMPLSELAQRGINPDKKWAQDLILTTVATYGAGTALTMLGGMATKIPVLADALKYVGTALKAPTTVTQAGLGGGLVSGADTAIDVAGDDTSLLEKAGKVAEGTAVGTVTGSITQGAFNLLLGRPLKELVPGLAKLQKKGIQLTDDQQRAIDARLLESRDIVLTDAQARTGMPAALEAAAGNAYATGGKARNLQSQATKSFNEERARDAIWSIPDAYTADHEHPYCSIVNTSLVHALGFVILPLSVHDQSNLTVFFA